MTRSVDGYDRPARAFHWLTALLVLGMIPAGLVMIQEGLPRPLQDALFIFHKNTGVLVLLLVIARLLWRAGHRPAERPALPVWQDRLADLNHLLLYALLLAMPLSGYVRVRAGGFPIEVLDAMNLPALVPKSKPLAEFAEATHFYAAWTLIAVVCLHLAAALYHGMVRRDGILRRMWPPVGS